MQQTNFKPSEIRANLRHKLPAVWRRAELAEVICSEDGGMPHEAYAVADRLIKYWKIARIIEKAGGHTRWKFKKE